MLDDKFDTFLIGDTAWKVRQDEVDDSFRDEIRQLVASVGRLEGKIG